MSKATTYRKFFQTLVDMPDEELDAIVSRTLINYNANAMILEETLHDYWNQGKIIRFAHVTSLYDSLLLHNADASIHKFQSSKNSDIAANIVMEINRKIVDQYSAELFPDTSKYMTAPTMVLEDGTAIEARTRSLATRLTLDTAQDINVVSDYIAGELRTEINRIDAAGLAYYPYVLANSYGITIDPTSFEPVISFSTRFGVGPKS